MKNIGFFSEMELFDDNGTIKDYIAESVSYDKSKVVEYLESFNYKAVCPRASIDCLTGEIISNAFRIYEDGEFRWCDFLIYHIEKYNIKLPQELVTKAHATRGDKI